MSMFVKKTQEDDQRVQHAVKMHSVLKLLEVCEFLEPFEQRSINCAQPLSSPRVRYQR